MKLAMSTGIGLIMAAALALLVGGFVLTMAKAGEEMAEPPCVEKNMHDCCPAIYDEGNFGHCETKECQARCKGHTDDKGQVCVTKQYGGVISCESRGCKSSTYTCSQAECTLPANQYVEGRPSWTAWVRSPDNVVNDPADPFPLWLFTPRCCNIVPANGGSVITCGGGF